jgi:hypothetical protein
MTPSEALALKNATMSEVDTVEGPPTARIDSLRSEDDRDRIAQSEAPEGQSELIAAVVLPDGTMFGEGVKTRDP